MQTRAVCRVRVAERQRLVRASPAGLIWPRGNRRTSIVRDVGGIKGPWSGVMDGGVRVRVDDSRDSAGHVFVCVSFPGNAFMVSSSSNPAAQLRNLQHQANPRAQLCWTSLLCADQHAAETIAHELLNAHRCEPELPWYLLDLESMTTVKSAPPSDAFPPRRHKTMSRTVRRHYSNRTCHCTSKRRRRRRTRAPL
jgi:hypothetical protein